LLVTKHPEWYRENMDRWFADVSIVELKGYYLVHAKRDDRVSD
jgi:hypothetical protein